MHRTSYLVKIPTANCYVMFLQTLYSKNILTQNLSLLIFLWGGRFDLQVLIGYVIKLLKFWTSTSSMLVEQCKDSVKFKFIFRILIRFSKKLRFGSGLNRKSDESYGSGSKTPLKYKAKSRTNVQRFRFFRLIFCLHIERYKK